MFYAFFCYLLQFGYYILQFYFVFLVLQVKYEHKAIFHSFFFRLLITLFVIALLGLSLCYHIAAWRYPSLFIYLSFFFFHLMRSIVFDMIPGCFTLVHFILCFSSFFFISGTSQREIEKNLLLHMPFDIQLIGMSCEPSKIQIALSHFASTHYIIVPFRL